MNWRIFQKYSLSMGEWDSIDCSQIAPWKTVKLHESMLVVVSYTSWLPSDACVNAERYRSMLHIGGISRIPFVKKTVTLCLIMPGWSPPFCNKRASPRLSTTAKFPDCSPTRHICGEWYYSFDCLNYLELRRCTVVEWHVESIMCGLPMTRAT